MSSEVKTDNSSCQQHDTNTQSQQQQKQQQSSTHLMVKNEPTSSVVPNLNNGNSIRSSTSANSIQHPQQEGKQNENDDSSFDEHLRGLRSSLGHMTLKMTKPDDDDQQVHNKENLSPGRRDSRHELERATSLDGAHSSSSNKNLSQLAAFTLQGSNSLESLGQQQNQSSVIGSSLNSPEPPIDNRNLIVNYIPLHISEDNLRTLFQSYGRILRCKLVTDKFTGQSLGYGFIKYDDEDAAATATATLNGYSIGTKRLKVSVSKPPEREKKTNLYISGIPIDWTQAELEELVSRFGSIIECRVLIDPISRKGRGVGFARFESMSAAANAIQTLSGQTLTGALLPLIVKYADTSSEKLKKALAARIVQQNTGSSNSANHIGNMPLSLSSLNQIHNTINNPLSSLHQQQNQLPSVHQTHSRLGSLTNSFYDQLTTPNCQIQSSNALNQTPNSSLGYFQSTPNNNSQQHHQLSHTIGHNLTPSTPQHLSSNQNLSSNSLSSHHTHNTSPNMPNLSGLSTFSNMTAAVHNVQQQQQQQQQLTNSNLNSGPGMNQISVSFGQDFVGVCLFVYHLPLEASEQTMVQLFSNYSQVVSVKIMRDLATGRSKGFGFVNVANDQQAHNCINHLNGFQLGNKYLKVALKR